MHRPAICSKLRELFVQKLVGIFQAPIQNKHNTSCLYGGIQVRFCKGYGHYGGIQVRVEEFLKEIIYDL